MAKVYRFTIHGKDQLAEDWNFGLHYQTDVPLAGTEPSAAYVLTELIEHFSTSGTNLLKLANLMTLPAKIVKCTLLERVETWNGDVPSSAEQITTVFGVSTQASDTMPKAAAVWYKTTTAQAGKSFRGGTHGPPMGNPSILDTSGAFDTSGTFWTNALALAAAIADPLNDNFQTTGDINPVVYSETRRRRGQSFTAKITACTPQTDVRWLRRRMVGRGT